MESCRTVLKKRWVLQSDTSVVYDNEEDAHAYWVAQGKPVDEEWKVETYACFVAEA